MEILAGMPELIEDEAEDAMKYAHMALENREDYPDIADMFMKISGEELHHMQMISDKLTGMVEALHAKYNGA